METQVKVVENIVQGLLAEESSFFLVEVKIKPTNNVKVFVDGDNGISIEKCVLINRFLYKQIEGAGLFPDGDFSLEVSSPGLDEPLKLHRQYIKNVGRIVEVIRRDGIKTEGKLLSITDTEIVVEEEMGKNLSGRPTGKKKEWVQQTILFENIKSTKIQIRF